MVSARPPEAIEGFTWRSLFRRRDSDLLLLIGLGLAAVMTAIFFLPYSFYSDSWLALVTGRGIFFHGLPHHETLTIFSHGRLWVDQQWLAQLLTYIIWRLGGLGLIGVVYVLVVMGTLTGTVFYARRRGASLWGTVLVLLPALWIVLLFWIVRTQFYAFPLFAVLLILLIRESTSPSKRIWWVYPILILWANLHGSVTLGVGLVVIYALTQLKIDWRRALTLLFTSPLVIFVTPYGLSTWHYYHDTLFNGALHKYASEWWPLYSHPQLIAVVPIALIFTLGVWALRKQSTLFERLALLILAFGAILAIRNGVWLSSSAMILIAPYFQTRRSPRPAHRSLNSVLAVLVLVALVGSLVLVGLKPDGFFEKNYPQGVVNAVSEHPSAHILADSYYADYIIWRLPEFQGKLAFDDRFELLTSGQVRASSLLEKGRDLSTVCGYQLLVFERYFSPGAIKAFPQKQLIYRTKHDFVFLRSSAASRC